MEDEDCCQSDALLANVVNQAKVARQAIRCPYRDPEEAFTDGYIAGWFDGYFKPSSSENTLKEGDYENCSSYHPQ